MTPAEANAEAARWTGFARALSRRWGVPPLYTREDWEAEALLGLAKALATMDRTRPGTHSLYIERVVTNHLKRCIRAVRTPPARSVAMQAYRRDESWAPGPPRATYAKAKRMDEARDLGDGDVGTLHDTTPSPASPDPMQSCAGAELVGRVADAARAMPEAQRRTVGFLLRGFTMTEEAEATGETTGAVRGRRTRVRQKLALEVA